MPQFTRDSLIEYFRQQGANPNDYDIDASLEIANKEPEKLPESGPTQYSIGDTLLKTSGRTVVPALGGGLGAAGGAELGMALGAFGGPLAPITIPVGGLIGAIGGGLGGSYLTGKAQEKVLQSVQGPEGYQKSLEELEEAKKQNPVSGFVGETAPMFLMGRPSLKGFKDVGKGIVKLGTGASLAPLERQALQATASNIGIGAGTDVANQALSDQPYNVKSTLHP